jgi:hypothetical protein
MQHNEMAAGKWETLTFAQQMANIGSEVGRAINWRDKNKRDYSRMAFERALELLDLTVNVVKGFSRRKELLRVREALVDYFVYENTFKSSDKLWQNYFLAFNYFARLH